MYTKKSYKKVAFILILVLIATMVPIMSSAADNTVYLKGTGGNFAQEDFSDAFYVDCSFDDVSANPENYSVWHLVLGPKGAWNDVTYMQVKFNNGTLFEWNPNDGFSKNNSGPHGWVIYAPNTYEMVHNQGEESDSYIKASSSPQFNISGYEKGSGTEDPKGQIKINKKSSTGSDLGGAWFSLFKGDMLDKTGETNEDGYLEFKGLEVSDAGIEYTLEETTPPAGYIGPSQSWIFSLTTDNPNKSFTGGDSIVNTPEAIEIKGFVELDKINPEEDGLGGAWFTLSDGAGFTTSAATSSNGALSFYDLPIAGGDNGTEYTLEETTPPAGYLDTDLFTTTFALTETSPSKSFTGGDSIVNTPEENLGSVQLLKKDAVELDKLLDGAIFSLKNLSTGVIVTAEAISGKAIWSNIPYGEYLVEEIQAAPGYSLNSLKLYRDEVHEVNLIEDFIIIVDDEIPNYILEGTNTPEEVLGSLTLTKLNEADISPIAGAKFELFNSNNVSQGEKTTDSNGVVSWGGLTIGEKYYLQETKPAPDFMDGTLRLNGMEWVGTEKYEVLIGEDEPDLTLTATNEEYILGEGADPPVVAGETATDPFEQEVLGEEAKTGDTMNIMLMLFFILAAIAVTGGILARRKTDNNR